jgi:phospholipid-binding lipoprotein MlaA
VGFFVDFLLDPVDYVEGRVLAPDEQIVKLGIRLVDTRAGLRDQGEQLLVGAADPYATVRSAWLQLRRYEIFDGNLPDEEEMPAEELPPLPADDEAPADAPSPAEAPSPSPSPGSDSATAPSTPEATDPAPAPQPD